MEHRMTPTRWFQYPFRIFFLSLAAWSLLVIPLWLGTQLNGWKLTSALPLLLWHEHEMIFGLLMPAIAGFLLTAVCVWTQTDRLHGWSLFGLWLVWLAGRVSVTFGGSWPAWLPIVLNLAFTALIFWDVARRVLPKKQWRQVPILIVLLALLVTQATVFLASDIRYQLSTLHASLVATCGIMMVIGGRITPAFSGNWLRKEGRSAEASRIKNPGWLQHLTLGFIIVLTALIAVRAPGMWIAGAAALAAIGCFARIALWRGWYTLQEPMLWILHLSLLWIPLGFVLMVFAQPGPWGAALWGHNVWSHALGVGAMGGLIIGVMTRVSLGHTGRPLVLPKSQLVGYALIHAGALIRVLTAMKWIGDRPTGLILSGVCWSLAFLIFLIPYAPILSLPRADGKPG